MTPRTLKPQSRMSSQNIHLAPAAFVTVTVNLWGLHVLESLNNQDVTIVNKSGGIWAPGWTQLGVRIADCPAFTDRSLECYGRQQGLDLLFRGPHKESSMMRVEVPPIRLWSVVTSFGSFLYQQLGYGSGHLLSASCSRSIPPAIYWRPQSLERAAPPPAE